ncbi:hypothetical protein FIBSPDRAFT_861737, partial [Athelia psychrophila]
KHLTRSAEHESETTCNRTHLRRLIHRSSLSSSKTAHDFFALRLPNVFGASILYLMPGSPVWAPLLQLGLSLGPQAAQTYRTHHKVRAYAP